jgi:PTS system sucrose-specific IIC component
MLQLTTTNANFIFPMLALSNMAQGAAVFAVVYMLRKDAKMREQGNAAAITC